MVISQVKTDQGHWSAEYWNSERSYIGISLQKADCPSIHIQVTLILSPPGLGGRGGGGGRGKDTANINKLTGWILGWWHRPNTSHEGINFNLSNMVTERNNNMVFLEAWQKQFTKAVTLFKNSF